jgi:hypothetical protein
MFSLFLLPGNESSRQGDAALIIAGVGRLQPLQQEAVHERRACNKRRNLYNYWRVPTLYIRRKLT